MNTIELSYGDICLIVRSLSDDGDRYVYAWPAYARDAKALAARVWACRNLGPIPSELPYVVRDDQGLAAMIPNTPPIPSELP